MLRGLPMAGVLYLIISSSPHDTTTVSHPTDWTHATVFRRHPARKRLPHARYTKTKTKKKTKQGSAMHAACAGPEVHSRQRFTQRRSVGWVTVEVCTEHIFFIPVQMVIPKRGITSAAIPRAAHTSLHPKPTTSAPHHFTPSSSTVPWCRWSCNIQLYIYIYIYIYMYVCMYVYFILACSLTLT